MQCNRAICNRERAADTVQRLAMPRTTRKGQQRARDHWQMCNARRDGHHATCNMHRETMQQATQTMQHATCNRRHTASNRQPPSQHAPCSGQPSTHDAPCKGQHAAVSKPHATAKRAAYIDNVSKTTDAMQRATEIMQPSTGDMRQTAGSRKRAKTANNRKRAAFNGQQTTCATASRRQARGSMQRATHARCNRKHTAPPHFAFRARRAAGSGQPAAWAKPCTRQPARNTAQTPHTRRCNMPQTHMKIHGVRRTKSGRSRTSGLCQLPLATAPVASRLREIRCPKLARPSDAG